MIEAVSRRGFFKLLGGIATAAATALVLPELELLLPEERKIISIPSGIEFGRNQLLTIDIICREALKMYGNAQASIHRNLVLTGSVNRGYDHDVFPKHVNTRS